MRTSLFLICCCFAGTMAWLAPERCRQGKSRRAAGQDVKKQATTLTAEQIADLQQARTEKDYGKYKFQGVPIRGTCEVGRLTMFSASNCKFYTYAPRSIGSVACTSTDCKLYRAVSTVDTYTSDEGYNWGVAVSSKVSLGSVFEIGAEASTGGEYKCSYTKGKTTTDTVECAATSSNGVLQLYNVRTDMICDFGTFELEQVKRDNAYGVVVENQFTKDDVKQIKEYTASFFKCRFPKAVMIDTSRIPDRLLQKVMKAFPKYDPYTDVITFEDGFAYVIYYKAMDTEFEYQKVVPFTNQGGDSVYQYACIFEPNK